MGNQLSVIRCPQVEFGRLGATFSKGISFDVWRPIGKELCGLLECSLWALGDWVNAGDVLFGKVFGSKYVAALKGTGFKYGTLCNVASVCRRVEFSRRREELSFWYHAEVAGLSAAEQSRFLKLAIRNGWDIADLRQAIRKAKATEGEEGGGGVGVGFVLSRHVGDITRWFGAQCEAEGIEDMPMVRVVTLLRALEPLEEIIRALRARTRPPGKESISATTQNR